MSNGPFHLSPKGFVNLPYNALICLHVYAQTDPSLVTTCEHGYSFFCRYLNVRQKINLKLITIYITHASPWKNVDFDISDQHVCLKFD